MPTGRLLPLPQAATAPSLLQLPPLLLPLPPLALLLHQHQLQPQLLSLP